MRLWSGELRVRDKVAVAGAGPVRVTEVGVSTPGGVAVGPVAGAGQIAVVRGPAARIGDTLCHPGGQPPQRRTHAFPPATLEALVEPVDPTQRTALFAGLTELADEDPLIALRLDETDGEAAVSLHGEVQKEVIGALLEERYGVRARFSDTSVVCLERVVATGSAVDRLGERGNPYLASVGLRVEARPVGHGVEFSPGVERGNLPPAFVAATEEGVRAALGQGPHGWVVTDCKVTMTESRYCPRQSKPHQKFDKSISTVAADFRYLTPVVLFAALAEAGTRVCRPVDRFDLELPDDVFGPVTALLGRLGGATARDQRGRRLHPARRAPAGRGRAGPGGPAARPHQRRGRADHPARPPRAGDRRAVADAAAYRSRPGRPARVVPRRGAVRRGGEAGRRGGAGR